jgi:hypothetical protein
MSEEQLREDISKQIHKRLVQWARDSSNLYDMAGISDQKAVMDIIVALLAFLAQGVVSLKLDEDNVIFSIKTLMELERRHDAKEKSN